MFVSNSLLLLSIFSILFSFSRCGKSVSPGQYYSGTISFAKDEMGKKVVKLLLNNKYFYELIKFWAGCTSIYLSSGRVTKEDKWKQK